MWEKTIIRSKSGVSICYHSFFSTHHEVLMCNKSQPQSRYCIFTRHEHHNYIHIVDLLERAISGISESRSSSRDDFSVEFETHLRYWLWIQHCITCSHLKIWQIFLHTVKTFMSFYFETIAINISFQRSWKSLLCW